MTQRENFFAMMKGEPYEFIPMSHDLFQISRVYCLMDHPLTTGKDLFGADWIKEPEGMLRDPRSVVFDDITQWKEYMKFPDPATLPFEEFAAKELPNFNREEKLLAIYSTAGLFERMTAMVGFEETLCSLVLEPEACYDFFSAVADFKIACYNRIIDLYHPDVINYFDDMCSANAPMMSQETYRQVLKPHHKRIVDAVHSKGVLFMQHMCGTLDYMVDELVDIGVDIWNPAQPINDLDAIMEKYKGKLIVAGGWDTQGPCSLESSTEDLVIEETKRCRAEYCNHGNYIFHCGLVFKNGNAIATGDPRWIAVRDTWRSISRL